MSAKPKTLQQAMVYFADVDNGLKFMVECRWPNGVECPACGRDDVRFISTRRMWECKSQHPKKQFGVTQKSAWFMLHRIRLAMQARSFLKLGGPDSEVEVDETFVGGAARFMHADKHRRRITETGTKDKTPIFGILERGGEVRAAVVPNRKKKALHGEIKKHVAAGSAIYSDALMSYQDLKPTFAHQVIDHAESYVDGQIHTNGLENFWSLLKRGIKGTYVSVEPFHLFRYLDEQVFRYNFRELAHDGLRFEHVASHILGKRLTYAEVTGKVGATPSLPN